LGGFWRCPFNLSSFPRRREPRAVCEAFALQLWTPTCVGVTSVEWNAAARLST